MKNLIKCTDCIKKKILIAAVCIAVNFLGSVFVRFFNIPLYLDSILTIALASL